MDRYGIEETRTFVLQSEEASSLLTLLKYRANNFLIYIPRTLLSLSLHARDTINTLKKYQYTTFPAYLITTIFCLGGTLKTFNLMECKKCTQSNKDD